MLGTVPDGAIWGRPAQLSVHCEVYGAPLHDDVGCAGLMPLGGMTDGVELVGIVDHGMLAGGESGAIGALAGESGAIGAAAGFAGSSGIKGMLAGSVLVNGSVLGRDETYGA